MCYSMSLLPRLLDEEMDCQVATVKDNTKELCYHREQDGQQGVPGVLNKNKNDIKN